MVVGTEIVTHFFVVQLNYKVHVYIKLGKRNSGSDVEVST